MPNQIASSLTVKFDKAIELARDRNVTLPAVYYDDLPEAARATAFTVSNLSSLQQIEQVLIELGNAIDTGETFTTWRQRISKAVPTLTPSRLETIFRNAVQTAYNSGHRLEHIEHESTRPYLLYDAINDSRTRDSHRAMDGFIAPVGHVAWKKWTPPNGHNCRCGVISLTAGQARARGYTGSVNTRGVSPDDGWAYDPTDPIENRDRLTELVRKVASKMPGPIERAITKRIQPRPVRPAKKK